MRERHDYKFDKMARSNKDNTKSSCLASYASETVMKICHGRRRCSLVADATTFGQPCKAGVQMHLKVVYTCIPHTVLKDRYKTASDFGEAQQTDLDLELDEFNNEDQFYKESDAFRQHQICKVQFQILMALQMGQVDVISALTYHRLLSRILDH